MKSKFGIQQHFSLLVSVLDLSRGSGIIISTPVWARVRAKRRCL